MQNYTWPILTEYDENHLARIALPLGGIGTVCVVHISAQWWEEKVPRSASFRT